LKIFAGLHFRKALMVYAAPVDIQKVCDSAPQQKLLLMPLEEGHFMNKKVVSNQRTKV